MNTHLFNFESLCNIKCSKGTISEPTVESQIRLYLYNWNISSPYLNCWNWISWLWSSLYALLKKHISSIYYFIFNIYSRSPIYTIQIKLSFLNFCKVFKFHFEDTLKSTSTIFSRVKLIKVKVIIYFFHFTAVFEIHCQLCLQDFTIRVKWIPSKRFMSLVRGFLILKFQFSACLWIQNTNRWGRV